MRFFWLGILLLLPISEIVTLTRLVNHFGWWVGFWLIGSALFGFILIKEARLAMLARITEAVAQGRFSLGAMIDSARTVCAGLLLIFPGIISDIMALSLLIWPRRAPATADLGQRPGRATRDGDIIDGQFRRES